MTTTFELFLIVISTIGRNRILIESLYKQRGKVLLVASEVSQSLCSFKMKVFVIPAKAGIHILAGPNKGKMPLKLAMDSHLRGNDNGELMI